MNYQFLEDYKEHINNALKEEFVCVYVDHPPHKEDKNLKDFLNDTSR